jgi:hypothetical protein
MGFVNCDWALKGLLLQSGSRFSAEGVTYDGKLYTFQELDYRTIFDQLTIFVKQNTDENQLRNLSINAQSVGLMSSNSLGEELPKPV